MSRLFVGNFDFEHHLADDRSLTSSARMRRLHAELATIWLAVAEPGDAIWMPHAPPVGFVESLRSRGFPNVSLIDSRSTVPSGLILTPWGWTPSMVSWGRKINCDVNSPDLEAVRKVNSRRFSWHWEREWGIELPHAAELGSVADVQNHLKNDCNAESHWVLKAEFGMSGRERMLGKGNQLSSMNIAWLTHRLRQNRFVYFEPWVDKVDEVGLQFVIPLAGSPEFKGCARLLSDSRGQYLGSHWSPDLDTEWLPEIEWGMRLTQEVQHAGYVGPLGIDAMRYRDENGAIQSRPIQDVNARYTMGRLLLECRQHVPQNQSTAWIHLSRPARQDVVTSVNAVELSPDELTDESGETYSVEHRVYLLHAENESKLKQKESALIDSESGRAD